MVGFRKISRYFREWSAKAYSLSYKYPYRVECNVCGWKGRKLSSDPWHKYSECPKCVSQVRHRLLFAAIQNIDKLGAKNLIQGKRILHFAPEPVISQLLMEKAAKYVNADLCRDDVNMRLDMCHMHNITDSSFDLVVACDVLEHVPDDSAALKEIYRILTINGWVILTIPQKDNLATTYYDNTVTTPEGRKLEFGQEDHLRIYGDDFGHFLESHGFTVFAVNEQNFDLKMVKKHVLFPSVLSSHPLATNYRKVYFGQKPN